MRSQKFVLLSAPFGFIQEHFVTLSIYIVNCLFLPFMCSAMILNPLAIFASCSGDGTFILNLFLSVFTRLSIVINYNSFSRGFGVLGLKLFMSSTCLRKKQVSVFYPQEKSTLLVCMRYILIYLYPIHEEVSQFVRWFLAVLRSPFILECFSFYVTL